MKFSILRVDEALPDLKLRSIHNPEKKDSTISAIAEGARANSIASTGDSLAWPLIRDIKALRDGKVVAITTA